MKTVVFEDGPLKELYPAGIQVNAKTPIDAIALLENFPHFRPDDGERHHVRLPDFPSRDALYVETDLEVIRVVSVPMALRSNFQGQGQKVMAVVQIVVGIILIWASMGTAGPQGYALMAAGIANILGGILALMMKAPAKSKNENDPSSQYLPASKNTVKIGTTIPLVFGRRRVYGHLISFNVTATNIQPGPTPIVPGSGGAADIIGVSSGSTWAPDGYPTDGSNTYQIPTVYSDDWHEYQET